VGKALAHLTGTYDTSGVTASVKMKLAGQGMPVTDLQGVLPAVGVTLPSGASLASGGLNVNLTLDGPVDKLVIVGPVNLENAKLAGFDLKSKLGALSSFTGIGGGQSGPDTDIQTFSANLRVDPQGEKADNVNLVVPSIGTITGNGTVSASQQLDCKMVAKVVASGGAIGGVASILGGGSGGGKSALTIPFTVKGTTANPQFVPDVSGAMNSLVKSNLGSVGNVGKGGASDAASAASSVLGGFLKKKQQ
jgi:AsmA protein